MTIVRRQAFHDPAARQEYGARHTCPLLDIFEDAELFRQAKQGFTNEHAISAKRASKQRCLARDRHEQLNSPFGLGAPSDKKEESRKGRRTSYRQEKAH